MILIDGDIVCFRAAFSAEDEEEAWVACSRASIMIEDIMEACNDTDVEVWLSGNNNFRYNVYPEYKANRIGAQRPKWEQAVREYLIQHHEASVSDGCEADDMLGARASVLKEAGNHVIIATIDKDLDQIPGDHYNFVKKEHYVVSNEEATRFFYYQCLVGDVADGVKGVFGIGPKKANKLLDSAHQEALCNGTSVERAFYDAVVEQFSCYEEFEMTAKVLHIWKKPDDTWRDNFK